MFGFIQSVFVLGFTLLSLGGIAEITYDLAKASADHQSISLGQWNRALYGEGTQKRPNKIHKSTKVKETKKRELNNLLRIFG
jgi:hypothetical protein